MTAVNPPRPVLRWHGGKWLLAPWIIGQFGPHRVYVEPFGGALPRTEVLWLNPAAAAARPQPDLIGSLELAS